MTYFIYNQSGKQIRTTKSQLLHNVQNITVTKTYIRIKNTLPRLKWYITITIQRSVREARQTETSTKTIGANFRLGRVILVAAVLTS